MPTLTFRNRDGELVDVPTVAATRFKNEFGTIFEQAALGGAVAITKHNTPKAVLLSYAEFEALTKASTPALDDLSDEFDQLLESMQTPQSKSAMASAFDATPEQLGRAAVKAAPSASPVVAWPARPKRRACTYSPGSTAQARAASAAP